MSTALVVEKAVPRDLADSRIDRVVAVLFSLPTAAARRLCEQGRVRVGGAKQSKGDRVKAGAVVVVEGPGWFVDADAAALTVLHSNAEVIIVDKPAGIACHPLVPGEGNTMADRVVARFPEVRNAAREEREAGLLHRLDTGTSGCLAFARSGVVWDRLRQDFDAVEKSYLAIVHGACPACVVDEALAHDPSDPRRMVVDAAGRSARTIVTPLSTTTLSTTATTTTLVMLGLHGGRRHQLRVHLAHLGHPLVGDLHYPFSSDEPAARADVKTTAGFFLHAWRLGIAGVLVEAPLSRRFQDALKVRALTMPPL